MVKKGAATAGILFFLFAAIFVNSGYAQENMQENKQENTDDDSWYVPTPEEEAQNFSNEMQQGIVDPAKKAAAPQNDPVADMGMIGNMTPEDTIAFYENVTKTDPENYVAWTALGDLYANVRFDVDKCLKCYEKAIEINDKYDLAHLGLGLAYGGLKMNSEARRELQKAIVVSKRSYVQEAARQALMSLGQ